MASDKLNSNYITELFALALHKQTIFDIVKQYLKFQYLQVEPEKKLWQWLSRRYDLTGKIPTIGQIQQQFSDDEKVLELVLDIKEVEIDEGDDKEIIDTFENFIKKMKFLDANDKITDAYNQGKKEQAWEYFVKYADEFGKFSIHDAECETVFGDFYMRQARRRSEDWNKRYKIATGIDELDYRLGGENGGPETGEYVLWLGDSGAGKSQVLVHCGITAARQGEIVAHFQLEGTKEQCLNRYDAAWTGTLYQDIKMGNISEKKLSVTKKVIERLKRNDIFVFSEEEFNAMTLVDARRKLKEIEKKYGHIGCIIFDYLELLEPGDGHNYSPGEERFRQAKLSKGMKMLAMEFNSVVHSATQSSNIPEECKNDPEFVITRANLSEDKGKIRPADIFVTLNQTRDEQLDEIMRLNTDKLRDYKNGKPIRIANNFSHARFYDRKRTMALEDEED